MTLVNFAIIIGFATILGMWFDGVMESFGNWMHQRWYKKYMVSQGYKYNDWDAEWKLPGEPGYNGENPRAFKPFVDDPSCRFREVDSKGSA